MTVPCGQVTRTEIADLGGASWDRAEETEKAEFSLKDRKRGASGRKEIRDGEESHLI